MLLWFGFIACTAAIVYAGTRLSRYGDIIAEKSGLGRAWIGIVLMASVTSLPELITGLSSVTYAGAPDIAAGDVLGSCVFNLLILAFLDVFYRLEPLSFKAHHGHVLSGGFAILMLGLVAIGIFVGNRIVHIGWVSPFTVAFLAIYLIAMKMIFTYEKNQLLTMAKSAAAEKPYGNVSARKVFFSFSAHALLVVAAAVFLPRIGKGIAQSTGLGETFVGNILIAVSTSLPEVVVSIAAVRLGAVDLAVGNLFGSNIFNIFILGLDDIFYVRGPLLAIVNPGHVISAVCAIIMTSIAVIGLTYRAAKKRFFMAWDSFLIMLVYILNIILIYFMK
jgi:cation:H+ antiporter